MQEVAEKPEADEGGVRVTVGEPNTHNRESTASAVTVE